MSKLKQHEHVPVRALAGGLVGLMLLSGCVPAVGELTVGPSWQPTSVPESPTPSSTDRVLIDQSPSPSPSPRPSFAIPTETRATVTRDDVRVTLELDATPLRVGHEVWARVTVKNLGRDAVRYFTDGCALPASILVVLGGEWIAGAPQTGIAAQFKTRTLTGFVAGAPHTLMGFTAEQHVGKNSGCLDVGLTHLLKPGRKITQRAVWTEWPHVPTPGVPVDLVATFPFAGRGEARTESDDRPIEVHLASAILDGEPWPWMTPAQAVDAALADPVFAAWLAEEPAASWINPSITLDPNAGTWTIGLFRDALGGAHGWAGQVTMDAVTGTVISHRFE